MTEIDQIAEWVKALEAKAMYRDAQALFMIGETAEATKMNVKL
jgi:hypothetical protein